MNLNLSVFWTLVVVMVGAPLLAIALLWGSLFLAIVLGYSPDRL